MKKQRFTEAQISLVRKKVEIGAPVAEVCRKVGITEKIFYRWESKYSGMLPSDMKRVKQFEKGNSKFKQPKSKYYY